MADGMWTDIEREDVKKQRFARLVIMKASEVHKMSDQELQVEQENLRKKLFELRTSSVTQKLEKPHQIGQMRRDIARILTETKARRAAKVKA